MARQMAMFPFIQTAMVPLRDDMCLHEAVHDIDTMSRRTAHPIATQVA
jgi:hypothetical protein